MQIQLDRFYPGDDFPSLRRAIEGFQQFSLELDTVRISADYQMLSEDDLVLVTGASPVTVTLPFIDDAQRKSYFVKRLGTANVTVAGATGELIDTVATQVITTQFTTLHLVPEREINITSPVREWHLV